MTRISFLVDGFNLYHSVHQAMLDLGGVGTKWLDLRLICDRLLYQIGGNARTQSIHYFSAPPTHVELEKPGAIERHQTYLMALRARDVIVELGKFKMKRRSCRSCGGEILSHEEKETDVAIAVRLLELCWNDKCDALVVLSADSDLSPALREVTRSFPEKTTYCCFPYARGSLELRTLVRRTFKLKKERYAAAQLPDPVLLPDGTRLAKPSNW